MRDARYACSSAVPVKLFNRFSFNSNDARAITIAIVKLVGGAGHGIVGGAGVNVHPRKLDCEIFADRPSAKIGSLENFRLYGIIQIN